MAFITIYALFGDDIRQLVTDKVLYRMYFRMEIKGFGL